MFWEEVVKKYGEEVAKKMSESKFLQGITCTVEFKDRRDQIATYNDVLSGDAAIDIPEDDIRLAYQDVILKEHVPDILWD